MATIDLGDLVTHGSRLLRSEQLPREDLGRWIVVIGTFYNSDLEIGARSRPLSPANIDKLALELGTSRVAARRNLGPLNLVDVGMLSRKLIRCGLQYISTVYRHLPPDLGISQSVLAADDTRSR